MTWSILARDEDGTFGIVIASRFLAVGGLCVYTRAGVGAVATQALLNPLYGGAGLRSLAEGRSADETVRQLTDADDGRDLRQVHVIAASGPAAAFTGERCVAWCGHHVDTEFSVAGNMLAGAEVLAATVESFRAGAGKPLAERLLDAIAAGDAAGGDKRGKQAAALRIQGAEEYPSLDLRVDDHAEPIEELRRLYAQSFERLTPFVACLPRRAAPAGITDTHEIERRVEAFRAEHGLGTG